MWATSSARRCWRPWERVSASYGHPVRYVCVYVSSDLLPTHLPVIQLRPFDCQGPDHLTLTWKLAPDVYSHVDIKEEGKENNFSLGKTLYIGTEEFEDLDEIIGNTGVHVFYTVSVS